MHVWHLLRTFYLILRTLFLILRTLFLFLRTLHFPQGIHEHLQEDNRAPWIFTKKECIEADACMKRIIGACSYEERPMGVMKSGKAANSHDTIQWATVYARWCFRKKGSARYTNNVCDIFDILAQLNATRLNAQRVQNVLRPRLISALVERCGLLPPSECMLTLHEVIHVCDQVIEVGAPRVSTLYKFERMNHVLKEMLKNSAKGLSFYVHFTSFYVHFTYNPLTPFYVHFTSFYAHFFIC